MHYVFYFKFILASAALAVSLLLTFVRWPFLDGRPNRAIIAYYALRVAVMALLLLKLHFGYPTENMGMYYYDAEIVLRGAVPNRDFYTLYGILFPYLLAGSVFLWHNRFAIIILLQVVEFAAVYAIFTQKYVRLSLRTFLIFAVNPIVLLWVWLGTSNQAMCLTAVAAALALRNETTRSVLFALAFASSKIFSLWTIIPALLCQRIRSSFLFAAVLLVIYTPFWLIGSTGLSMKATEASGHITDDAASPGIESLYWLIPTNSAASVTHVVLICTAGLLLAVMLAASGLRLRLGLASNGIADAARMGRDISFTAIFATLLTLTYQAFASYTIPEYFLGAIIMVPVLIQINFWNVWDQALVAVTTYLQAIIYLVWFHFAEFGNSDPHTSSAFNSILVLGNLCTISLWARCAYLAFRRYARELQTNPVSAS